MVIISQNGKIITSDLLSTRVNRKIGVTITAHPDKSCRNRVVADQVEKDVKEAAGISMGIKITEADEQVYHEAD